MRQSRCRPGWTAGTSRRRNRPERRGGPPPPPIAASSHLLARLRTWAAALKRDVVALWLAARDPRTPWPARLLAMAVAAYALSPIDLIPDFIPVLGYLDDLVLIPLGIAAVVALIPSPLMSEFRQEATRRAARPQSRAAAFAIVGLWVASAALLCWFLVTRLGAKG